jgi:hypothetical protein
VFRVEGCGHKLGCGIPGFQRQILPLLRWLAAGWLQLAYAIANTKADWLLLQAALNQRKMLTAGSRLKRWETTAPEYVRPLTPIALLKPTSHELSITY